MSTEWDKQKIKYLAHILNGKEINEEVEKDSDNAIDVYGSGGVFKYTNQYIYNGKAVLFGRKGTIGKPMYVEGKFWTVDTMFYVDCFDIEPKFLYYALTVFPWDYHTKTTTLPSIVGSDIANSKILFPCDRNVQREISDYLDVKVTQIERVVDGLYKEIDILDSTKKAIIVECTTRGLKSQIETKDSRIDYIGEIPLGWDVKKLRFLGRLQNGITKASDEFGQGDPFVSYGNVYNNYQLPEAVEGLVESSSTEQDIYSVKRGDVFFTRTSETIEEIGFASTCLKDIKKAVYAGFVIRFRPKDDTLLPEFSKYYFRSEIHRNFFVKEMNIITRASLGQDLLKNLPVLIPPKDEQEEIANYLDKKCKAIDNIIEAKKKQIETLEAHRKTLIFDYVTGTKRVKEAI